MQSQNLQILSQIDNILTEIENIFDNLWNNYKLNLEELIQDLVALQRDYKKMLDAAAETLGLGAGFLIEAAKLWIDSKNEIFEEDRKAKKWGAAILGIAGIAAAGYSIYKSYKAQKEIEKLKIELAEKLQKILEQRKKLIDKKIVSLKRIQPYVQSFQSASLILLDTLYYIGEDYLNNNEIVEAINKRLEHLFPLIFKFYTILLTIDFLEKNKLILYKTAFINPAFGLYIRETSYKFIDEIYRFLSEKYPNLNLKNPVILYLLNSPFVFYSSSLLSIYKKEILKANNKNVKEEKNVNATQIN
jgi:hypothetical protein